MKTRTTRKLTACLAALALATTGLVAGVSSGGVARAHACSASYGISAGNYANHGQNDYANVSWGCANQWEYKMTVDWGDGHQDTNQCYVSCSSGNFQKLHAYANAGVYSVCTWDDYGNAHVCVQVHIV
jgi:hypothetical protein